MPSNWSANYVEYVNHKLRLFARAKQTYHRDEMAKLNFVSFQARQRAMAKICDRISANQPTLVIIDPQPPIKKNSPIEGYRRCPLKALIKAFTLDPNIDVLFVPERSTTQLCSCCFQRLFVSTTPDRYVTCHKCVETNVRGVKNAICCVNGKFSRALLGRCLKGNVAVDDICCFIPAGKQEKLEVQGANRHGE